MVFTATMIYHKLFFLVAVAHMCKTIEDVTKRNPRHILKALVKCHVVKQNLDQDVFFQENKKGL